MMKTGRTFSLALLIALAATFPLEAQFWARATNPKVRVELQHPPGLDIQVERIAFGPATGSCSNEILQQLIDVFVANGIEVVDRQSIDRLLAEHDLTLSGYVDRSTAAELGNLLGPSALIMLEVTRCVVERERFSEEPREGEFLYFARTEAFVGASVRSIDLATGTIFAARSLQHSPSRTVESDWEPPPYPEDFEVLDEAFALITWDVQRMFLPWTESRELVFFDDKDCGLDRAFRALKNGDIDRTLEISLNNLEACEGDSEAEAKDVGQAYYNVGMSYRIRGEYDRALEYLRRSAELRPGDIVEEAISDTAKARDLLAAMRQVEERAEIATQHRQAEVKARRAASKLTNADVVSMTQQNLPEAIILAKIRASDCTFDTSVAGLVALNEAGVSQEVIIAMIAAQ